LLTFSNAAEEAGFAQAPESYKAVWSTFDNATGQSTRIGETVSKGRQMHAPPDLPATPGTFVRIELGALSASHATWAQPIKIYYRREVEGWKLVGLERMP
jgi:hypothetical protein